MMVMMVMTVIISKSVLGKGSSWLVEPPPLLLVIGHPLELVRCFVVFRFCDPHYLTTTTSDPHYHAGDQCAP